MSFRFLLAAALAAVPLATAAFAQANDKKLIIFGNDKCPAGTICVRVPDSERYRIPKTIRDTTPSTSAPSAQASLAASTAAVSASGIGSCSATGAGGASGCFRRDMQAARAQKQADRDAAPQAPQP